VASIITGTGMAVPEITITNDDLAEIMDTDDEWISTRSGVRQRQLSLPGHGSSELAIKAGTMAIADAAIHVSQIDALVTATMTPDFYAPGIVALVQDGLGLGAIPAFDLRQQCSGFLYGLDLADCLIAAKRAENVLVIGAEAHAGFFPWIEREPDGSFATPNQTEREANTRARSWAVLFGDGSGAMVVRKAEGNDGVIASRLFTDGAQFDLIRVPGVGSRFQPYVGQEQLDEGLHLPIMDGGALYRSAVRLMPDAVRQVCEKAGVTVSDLDLVIAHQANDRILEGVRKQLGLPAEKVPSNIARYGNTTAGTLPILFHELRQEGRIVPGALVCFTAFGAGAHWGAVLYREPAANPPPKN
jgi:3-oxoacyl-[acyl-carrier-protein] synthase-3